MSVILRPGDAPPDITPYCGICDQPCERMQMDMLAGTDVIGLHSHCCDHTSSFRVPLWMYLEMQQPPYPKLYTIVRKGSQAGLRGRKSHGKLRSVG